MPSMAACCDGDLAMAVGGPRMAAWQELHFGISPATSGHSHR